MRGNYVLATMILSAAMMISTSARCSDAQTDELLVVKADGATTVANLIQSWVKEFENASPNVRVALSGGTMGKGFSALLNKNVNVCMGARELNREEHARAEAKGLRLNEKLLCYDAVAIVVHPLNPVSEISLDQLAKVFSGVYTTWDQLGGPSEPITVVTMPPDSGMRTFLCDLLKMDVTRQAVTESSIGLIIRLVESRKGAITFCRTNLALAGMDEGKLKALAIKKDENFPAIAPSHKSIADGSYPVIRPLTLIYDAAAEEHVKRFVDFVSDKSTLLNGVLSKAGGS